MLSTVIAWSLRNRWVVLGIALVVMTAGVFALRSLNIDAFPDTTPTQVQVNASAPALVPEEIERLITIPIEREMGGMRGLESIRSVSQFGLCNVILTFDDATPVYFARQLVREKLDSAALPDGVKAEMGPVATGLGEVFHYVLFPQGRDLSETRTIQDWKLKPQLRSVDGVAEVNSWGGLKKQYQVLIDPSQLLRYELTFEQVVAAIPANNLNVGGGNINQNGSLLLVHGVGRTTTIDEIENIVVAAREGVPIHLKDVASVGIGHELRRGMVTADGRGEVVLGLGFMLMGENSYGVTTRVREKFQSALPTLDKGVEPVVVYDRTRLVDEVLTTVKNNLCEGAFLVVLILYLMLGNLRVGLIAAVAIPVAMLFGFCGMWQMAIAGSLLSLGAIDFGIVVDSSVVVLESIVRKLSHHGPCDGEERLALIREATNEVKTPTVFGQLIILIVYLPILTLEGVEGKMFRPMAITVMFVLVGSLLASLTVTPVLASLFLPKRISEDDVPPVTIAKWFYRPLLSLSLWLRYPVLAASLLLVVVGGWLASTLGTEFVPRLSEGDLVIGIARAPGTSFEQSVHVNTQIEKILMDRFPNEVSHVWSRVGAPEVATDAGNLEATDMFVSLKPRTDWRKARTQSDLIKLMEAELDDIPGQIVWFTQPIEQRINEMVSGVRADVAVKIYGDDLESVMKKATELEQLLKTVHGCADPSTEQVFGQPILQVKIIQEAVARYGVSAKDLLALIEAISGTEVGAISEDQFVFPLVARLPEEIRNNPEAISDMLVASPTGEQIPLSRLATVKYISGAKMISREGRARRITVQCNVRDRDVGGFVAEAQQLIARKMVLPPDQFRLEWGGQFENMQRAQKRLTIVVPVALLMIIGLLFVSYRDVKDALLVFTGVPFACVGGIVALWFREMPLSIAAAVGFITLSGVSVLNSMVLVSYIRTLLASGVSARAAIEDAAITCLRTVMMTSLVASVGFAPMAVSTGTGAEVQQPLATVVIGGVISATLMSLFVLPGLYLVASTLFRRTLNATGPSLESGETSSASKHQEHTNAPEEELCVV
jgi:cobalt-zinc-cadmium resistance protein CzcA